MKQERELKTVDTQGCAVRSPDFLFHSEATNNVYRGSTARTTLMGNAIQLHSTVLTAVITIRTNCDCNL